MIDSRTMWRLIILSSIVVFSALAGCDEKVQAEKPEGLIEEAQMIEVLSDICKVEARYQRRLSLRGTNNTDLVLHNYNLIFEEHQVTLPQFKASYEYYEATPIKMQQLFDSVIVSLTKEEAVLREASNKIDSTHVVNSNYYE